MKRGQELVFAVDANDALDLVICHEEDIDAWTGDDEDDPDDEDEGDDDTEDEDQDDDDRSLPEGYWHKTGIIACNDQSFTAPKRGRYVLLLVNWDDDPTEVTVDAAVWEAED
jgi:hypothetical protein